VNFAEAGEPVSDCVTCRLIQSTVSRINYKV